MDLITPRQRPRHDPLAFAHVIIINSCRCGLVYDHTAIKRLLIEGMNDTIRNQTRRLFAMNQGIDNMAFYALDINARTEDPNITNNP